MGPTANSSGTGIYSGELDECIPWNLSGHPDVAGMIYPAAAEPNRLAGTILSPPGGWYDAGDYGKYGTLKMVAWQMNGEDAYKAPVREDLHYLLGRNAAGYCFVTGVGCLSTIPPHNRLMCPDGCLVKIMWGNEGGSGVLYIGCAFTTQILNSTQN